METSEGSPVWRGASEHTNQTGELTGLGEGMLWALENTHVSTSGIIIRPDSEYSMSVAMGDVTIQKNVELAQWVRDIYTKLCSKFEGRV